MVNLIRSFSTACVLSAAKVARNASTSKQTIFLGRPSNKLTAGIVGLANVGKSTFFQAITKSSLGNPANYPYATIEPSEARIIVESDKLNHLAKLYGSEKKVPTSLTVVDIAGLTRNAATGEGLGNKFLSDIRQVDGIFQVVRGFEDEEIEHIENRVDPVKDLEIVSDELILKDMDFAEIGLDAATKLLKKPAQDKVKLQQEVETLEKVLELLYEGRKVSSYKDWTADEVEVLNNHNFLTAKPSVFLLNVNEVDFKSQTNKFYKDVRAWVDEHSPGDEVVLFSGKYEHDLSQSGNDVGSDTALPNITDQMRAVLRLISFYTCGPIEAHQWTVREGSTAPEAAGMIHTDLQKTFISAQVYKYADLESETAPLDEAKLKSKGKQVRAGKAYIIEDGDVVLIKAGAGKSR